MSKSNSSTSFHHGHDGDGEREPHGVVDADGQEGHEHEQMPLAKTCCGREQDLEGSVRGTYSGRLTASSVPYLLISFWSTSL